MEKIRKLYTLTSLIRIIIQSKFLLLIILVSCHELRINHNYVFRTKTRIVKLKFLHDSTFIFTNNFFCKKIPSEYNNITQSGFYKFINDTIFLYRYNDNLNISSNYIINKINIDTLNYCIDLYSQNHKYSRRFDGRILIPKNSDELFVPKILPGKFIYYIRGYIFFTYTLDNGQDGVFFFR